MVFLRAGFASFLLVLMSVVVTLSASSSAQAEITAFKQAVAEESAKDAGIAAFYRGRNFEPIWTQNRGKDATRRKAFLQAISMASVHGLPAGRYDPNVFMADLGRVKNQRDLGRIEVQMSRLFVQYAQDISRGIVTPSKVDPGMVRKVSRYNSEDLLTAFTKSSPAGFLKNLAPKNPEYLALTKEKLTLEKQLGRGGWGPTVNAKKLEPGASGNDVVTLRNRLIVMGYMGRSASQTYDVTLQKAVQQFQLTHGLNPDGVAGAATISEINVPVEGRLKSVMVAMERERWLNGVERGKRHVWVNITDFHVRIIDDGKTTFETRSVVGKNTSDRQTPEFSDVMSHMVINPTWNVPRSIAVKEYLPMLKKNPNAVSHLRLINGSGQIVSREGQDFTQYSARNFPFDIKQPPSRGNALGLVKFMFPNRYNIYLHDTPAKDLFGRESRAFSHGCVRLRDPQDFAFALLARQQSAPEPYFKKILATGRETTVPLDQPIPVHIVYRTAITDPKGRTNYRRDVYGRDAKIFDAMQRAGVTLQAVQG
ncbi:MULTISPECIES: L,D-transpeptidase family protein [Falsihalocynthiibacter]|uniref:L,D-transpeptidase family protein n=1 Tax=Falsihalocynthiibacter TaxID=2854182 RepID=UPI0030022E39